MGDMRSLETTRGGTRQPMKEDGRERRAICGVRKTREAATRKGKTRTVVDTTKTSTLGAGETGETSKEEGKRETASEEEETIATASEEEETETARNRTPLPVTVTTRLREGSATAVRAGRRTETEESGAKSEVERVKAALAVVRSLRGKMRMRKGAEPQKGRQKTRPSDAREKKTNRQKRPRQPSGSAWSGRLKKTKENSCSRSEKRKSKTSFRPPVINLGLVSA